MGGFVHLIIKLKDLVFLKKNWYYKMYVDILCIDFV